MSANGDKGEEQAAVRKASGVAFSWQSAFPKRRRWKSPSVT